VTSFTWVLHKVFGDPSSPLVTQDGYHFDFVAMVGDTQPIGLRGMLAVVLPPEPVLPHWRRSAKEKAWPRWLPSVT
jgi:hypothetical protein